MGGEGRLVGTGIMVCGLNGAGKSTMGKVLAKELGFYLIIKLSCDTGRRHKAR